MTPQRSKVKSVAFMPHPAPRGACSVSAADCVPRHPSGFRPVDESQLAENQSG